ncbi:activator-dependent family glycosyltransferase [Nocardiopsis sp. CNT-189]|uniref:activator-dependent family glycosyltransferase n=1 Tax=Nocardiopsis oceanisediminis TaxID=2816862 RepID=UPI003B365191
MRVLFTSYAEPSHFRNMVPLAWAFLAAGHEVRAAGPPELMETAAGAGLTGVPVGRDSVIRSFLGRRPHLSRMTRSDDRPPFGRGDAPEEEIDWEYLHSGYADSVNWLFRMVNDPMINDLVEFAREWRADLVVWEPGTVAGAIAAKAAGAAHARIVLGLDFYGRMRELFVKRRDEEAGRPDPLAEWISARIGRFGGEFSEDMTTGMATIEQSPEAMRMPTGRPVVPVRYVPYNGRSVVPRWLWRAPERPRVCFSLGGSVKDPVAPSAVRIPEILEALADLDADVVATFPAEDVGTLPGNVHPVGFVPLNALLPHCSVSVNHGGFGSLNTALINGLPQLVIPEFFDAPAKGRRISALGAGLTLTAEEATGDAVRKGLEELLSAPGFRDRAAELRDASARMPSPAEAVPRLLGLAGERI